ncbi:MAG: DNA polymerase III subunit delta [Parcubacteria group bacterium CG_4_9_14_0_2_um_filter_35_11]|nr:MAG: DNA polymerase III subunit delta [Parcubacteria group bacterium CG07_land_8_20_14_0_80_35_11]PJC47441.1 MAG: DNA polymerase III subunit delta [Parcubacteria group bacterium CG_4_9_14_0_2_um_filter_35_11]
MVLFLYGPDTFRSKRKLAEIIGKYRFKYKSGLNFAKIELSEENFHDFRERIETVSMFKERKLIVLKNVFSLPKTLKERISEYLKKRRLFEDKNIILIFFEEGEIKDKNKLFRLLFQKSFKKQEFKELSLNQVRLFIKKEVEKMGGEIYPSTIEKLLFYFGNNLWQLENEIKKLISFKKGKVIEDRDVENLCEANINLDIFKTIEAISYKNKKRAMKLIFEHFQAGENELKIWTMIIYQFRNLMKIRSILEENKKNKSFQKLRQQFQKSGIHPFAIKKTLPIAKKFSIEELRKIYKELFEFDLKIKTGKIEPRLGIEMFIMGL